MMTLDARVYEFVREGFAHKFGKPAVTAKEDLEWRKVRGAGTRLWLDTGDIDEAAKLWNSSFDALTTNNTLLNKEIQKGIYDDLVAKAARIVLEAAPQISEADLILEIAFILNAHHALRLVDRFDAFVSVELHTDLSNDVERTVAYGKRYFAICPERFYVKVPLTPSGYLSARKLVLAGIPINFTLGFSARHNYVAALLTKPDYVNVFLGRLNSVVADNKLGTVATSARRRRWPRSVNYSAFATRAARNQNSSPPASGRALKSPTWPASTSSQCQPRPPPSTAPTRARR